MINYWWIFAEKTHETYWSCSGRNSRKESSEDLFLIAVNFNNHEFRDIGVICICYEFWRHSHLTRDIEILRICLLWWVCLLPLLSKPILLSTLNMHQTQIVWVLSLSESLEYGSLYNLDVNHSISDSSWVPKLPNSLSESSSLVHSYWTLC